MKVIKRNEFFKFIIIFYFLIFSEFVILKYTRTKKKTYKKYNRNLKEKYRSHSFKKFKNIEYSNFKNSTIPNSILPFKSSFGNLVGGLVEEMSSGEKRFYNCFPEDWLNNPNSEAGKSILSNQISGKFSHIGKYLKTLSNLGAPFINFICKYKEKIIMFIQGIFVKRTLRKYRIMVESGKESRALKMLERRYGWGFLSKITSGVTNWVTNTAKQVGKFVKDNVLDPLFKTFIAPIQNTLTSIVDGFKQFFTGNFMSRIENCMDALSSLAGKFDLIFKGLKAKFDLMRTSLSMGLPGIIVFIADFVIAMICEQKFLIKAVDLILKGLDMADSNHQNFNIGKGVGIFLRTFSLAPTLTGTILIKSKFRRLYFR